MNTFAEAVAARDVDAFLSHFSQQRSFTLLGTLVEPFPSMRINYAELARDMRTRDQTQGWYVEFMADEDESFALMTESAEHRPWKQVGKRKFVLPDDDSSARLFVVWRKEGRRWVIDTIAIPDA